MKESKYCILIKDGLNVTYDFDGTVDDCVEAILEEYERHDESMCDLVEFIEIKGLSVADVIKVYAKLFKASDDDETIRIADGEKLDLKK